MSGETPYSNENGSQKANTQDLESTQQKPHSNTITTTLEREGKALGVGVAAGAVVTGIPVGIEILTTHAEISGDTDNRIHFEPFRHPTSQAEWNKINAAFNAGDPDVHDTYYNSETTNRILSYKPQAISVDGLYVPPLAKRDYKTNRLYFDAGYKEWVWELLPARPAKLNPDGKVVYAVAGDLNDYGWSADSVGASLPPLGNNWKKFVDAMVQKTVDEEYINGSDTSDYIEALAGIALFAGFAGSQIEGWRLDRKTAKNDPNVQIAKPQDLGDRINQILQSKHSRRTVIRGLATGAAAIAIGTQLPYEKSYQSVPNAEFAPTEQDKNFWETANAYLRPQFMADIWLNGRTAMLIAKQEAAMDYLRTNKMIPDTATGTVLMGGMHDYQASIYLHDKAARIQAIQTYAERLIGITQSVVKQYVKLSEPQMATVTNQLLDYFGMTGVIPVYDYSEEIPNHDLKSYVNTNIPYAQLVPCPEITEATQYLRLPQ